MVISKCNFATNVLAVILGFIKMLKFDNYNISI